MGVLFVGIKCGVFFRVLWVLFCGFYVVVFYESFSLWLLNLMFGFEFFESRWCVRKNGFFLLVLLRILYWFFILVFVYLLVDVFFFVFSLFCGLIVVFIYVCFWVMRWCMGVVILVWWMFVVLGFGKFFGGGGDFEFLWLWVWVELGGFCGSWGIFWSKLGVGGFVCFFCCVGF